MPEEDKYVLAGYLRFVEDSPDSGVIAHVISKYAPEHAEPSDVPIYRRHNNKGIVKKADLDNK